MQNIEWDMQTITPGDYSKEFQISEKAYNEFLNIHYIPHDKPRGISPGESFKTYLKNEFEKLLTKKLEEKKAGMDDHERQHMKIN
jgi:hypothetical protein